MKRTLLRDALFGLLGALSLVGGIVLADFLFDDSAVTFPESEASFVIPLGDAAASDVPGAILTRVAVPVSDPPLEGATVLHPTVYDADGIPAPDAPPVSSDGSAGDEGAPGGAESDGSAGEGGAPGGTDLDDSAGQEGAPGGAESDGSAGDGGAPGGADLDGTAGQGGSPGAAAGNTMATITRFLDLCAETFNPGCPSGIGATVLFDHQLPPLQFDVRPEANPILFPYPDLRCYPQWPTQTVIPLVLLSNRPFSRLTVRLRSGDGTLLDEQVDLRWPAGVEESNRYDQRVADSKPIEPTLESGVHTCLQLEIDRLVTEAPDRSGPFVVTVKGKAGDDFLTKTVPFTGHYDAIRPPVLFHPVNANRAELTIYQLPDDTVAAWVYETSNSWDPILNAPRSCEGDPPPLETTALRDDPLSAPRLFSMHPGIDGPDYPWDRSYTHYTKWNLDLRNSTDYTLCIRWIYEGVTEEWFLETPDGIEVGIVGGYLRHYQSVDEGDLTVWQYGISGCKMVINPEPYQGTRRGTPFPAEDLTGNDTYTWAWGSEMCDSNGWWVASEIELQARYSREFLAGVAHPRKDAPAGVIYWPVAELISKCTDAEVGRPPCRSVLEWRTQNPRLCLGPWFTPSCRGDLMFFLQVDFNVRRRDSNNRPDPLDWGIFKIARLGDMSETVTFP